MRFAVECIVERFANDQIAIALNDPNVAKKKRTVALSPVCVTYPRMSHLELLEGVQFSSEETVLRKVVFAVCCAILWFVSVAQAQESHPGCSTKELNNLLRPSDPAYADAIALAATLQNHGSTILCILPSKFAQFLPRQTGASLFRTTIGDFEALFRPQEQNFDDVFISEERDENLSSWSSATGYRYIFRDPDGHKIREMSGREAFFMRHHNILFVTWQKNSTAALTESLRDER